MRGWGPGSCFRPGVRPYQAAGPPILSWLADATISADLFREFRKPNTLCEGHSERAKLTMWAIRVMSWLTMTIVIQGNVNSSPLQGVCASVTAEPVLLSQPTIVSLHEYELCDRGEY